MRLAALLLLSGCVTVGPGLPLTTLPAGISWCGSEPRKVQTPTEDPAPSLRGQIPAEILKPCSKILSQDRRLNSESWRGRIVFGFSTDEQGRARNMCVWGGSFGDVTEYVSCVVDKMQEGTVLPPNLTKEEWTLTFIMD